MAAASALNALTRSGCCQNFHNTVIGAAAEQPPSDAEIRLVSLLLASDEERGSWVAGERDLSDLEGTRILPIVRTIVRQHGGDIRFSSKPGRTVFIVALPENCGKLSS